MSSIIAFYSPYRGMGKTTAARAAVEALRDAGKEAEIISFADPIKRAYCAMFDIKESALYSGFYDKLKDLPPEIFKFSMREAMICIGESMKTLDPLIWIRLLYKKIDSNANKESIAVIDDLRFPREYYSLRENGAKIIRINRSENISPVLAKLYDIANAERETECLLNDCDFDLCIRNSGNINEFRQSVKNAVLALVGDKRD